MSENESSESMSSKLEAVNKKLISMNKTVKLILDKLEQKVSFENEAVEKKGTHGKPRDSTFEEKQASYLEMLNRKRIKEPTPTTLEFTIFSLTKIRIT